MVIECQSKGAARGLVFALCVTCLSAFCAFGNAVSVFGKTAPPASGNSRRKNAAKAPAKSSRTSATEGAGTESGAGSASAAEAQARAVFKKVGEPFVVTTADARPQATPPPSTPPRTPAQTDATRPPGTEQRQTVPPTARPNPPADPTAPPGTQRVSPTAPPGTQIQQDTRPATPSPQQATPTQPLPPTEPAQTDPTAPPAEPGTPGEPGTVQDPAFPNVEPRPVPPMPSLARVGVVNGDTLALTLNEAIRRALENNNDIEVARADVRLAEATLRSLEGIFDPVISYTPEINNSVRPVTNIFGGATSTGTVSTTDINNNFAITRQFGRGGGNYSYFFNNTRENTSALNTTLNPFFSSSQGIQFTQPLWRDRSIDRNRQQIRVQRKRLEQSDADFRRRTIDVISQVQRAYWDLAFALRDEQNQIANLNLTRENFRQTEARVAAGAVAPLERAEVQTELSNREAALLAATQGVTVAENILKNLLIKDPLSPEWSKVVVPTDQPSVDRAEGPIALEDALKEARTNRPELRRLKLQDEISAIDIQFFRNQTKPRIDLVGTLSTSGLAGSRNTITSTTPQPIIGDEFATDADAFLLQQINDLRQRQGLPALEVPTTIPQSGTIPSQFVGGYGQTLRNLFSLDTRNIVLGVTIQLPLKNRTAKANLAFAEIQREQLAASTRSQEQVIEVEVRNAVQVVETSRLRVLSARQARESAEEQLAGERRLYQVGRSTTFLLFQRENQLVNARNQELRAETDFSIALSVLQRATSTTLRVNNVIIDTPTMAERFRD